METSEEMRAVSHGAGRVLPLNMATFEWSIADGLVRSGSNAPIEGPKNPLQARIDQATTWNQRQPRSEFESPLSPAAGKPTAHCEPSCPPGDRRRRRCHRQVHLQHAGTRPGPGEYGVDDGRSRFYP